MAQLTINHNEVAFTADSGFNKKAVSFSNGAIQREFRVMSFLLDLEDMTYQVIFKEIDSDLAGTGYESPQLARFGVRGDATPYLGAGSLDLVAMKVNAINRAFLKKYEVEPIDETDNSVKPEFV